MKEYEGPPEAVKKVVVKDDMAFVIAQLRHLYSHMVNGTFSDAKKLADGLLSPQIQRLENMVKDE